MASNATRAVRVSRPPRETTLIRDLCRRNKTTPQELIATAVGSHATFKEAAESLGVAEFTLRRWRKRWPVEVVRD